MSTPAAAQDTPFSKLVPPTPLELHQSMVRQKSRAGASRYQLAKTQALSSIVPLAFDAQYYRLELSIDEVGEAIYGRLTMKARALTDGLMSTGLDLGMNLIVDSVYIDDELDYSWRHREHRLLFFFPEAMAAGEEFEITVVYNGHFPDENYLNTALYFSEYQGVPCICSSSECFYARTWWPCQDRPDDKADSVDVIVTVKSNFFVSSNGVLRDSVDNGATTTYWWHEQYPITTYLVAVAISEYEHSQSWYHYGPGDTDSMVVDFYSFPKTSPQWTKIIDMIEFFSDTFCEYPFIEEKYAMTHFVWSQGAMENQTNSSMGVEIGDEPDVMSHELAHQWVGDYITCETMHDIWLNEGFATYAEVLYNEYQYGPDAIGDFFDPLETIMKSLDGSIYVDDISSDYNIFTFLVYFKGARVLNMLRHHVGDSTFFNILREYCTTPAFTYGNVNTSTFRALCESVSGQNLYEFFQDWIYGEFYPKYQYRWAANPGPDGTYNVYLIITQYQLSQPQVFDMPIDIHIEHASGVIDSLVVYNDSREQEYVLSIVDDQPPVAVQFDSGNWILKTVYEYPYPLRIIDEELAAGRMLLMYQDSIVAIGGTPPYHFTVAEGALPEGLALDEVSGVIAGTPLAAGEFSFVVRVNDAVANVDTETCSLFIEETTVIPGDLDVNGRVDPLDVAYMVMHVYRGAPPPPLINTADVNGDCMVNPVDVVMLASHVYKSLGVLSPGCVE